MGSLYDCSLQTQGACHEVRTGAGVDSSPRIVDVRLDVFDVGTALSGQLSGPAQRLTGEVDADDPAGTLPFEADGVGAEVGH